jgi:hypothetical protein
VASRADRPPARPGALGPGPVALVPGDDEAKRVLGDPRLARLVGEVRSAADEARRRPIAALPASGREDFMRTGDRLLFERPYFERRRSLVALGLASWLWRGREDLAALERLFEAICLEERWALSAHSEDIDLFACETSFALAEISACLGPSLTPAIAQRARDEVERRVLGPFMEGERRWAWEDMRNNWCAVCAGSIGAAAIYLVGGGPRLDAILLRLEPTLAAFLESFAEDGTCLEGLGYWTYGVGFYVSFAELLRRFYGGRAGGPAGGPAGARRGLMDGEKFRRIAAFQSKAYLTDSIAVAFADSDARSRYRPGLAAYLARRFPEAVPPAPSLAAGLADDECGRWCLSFRDLLWSTGPTVAVGAGPAGPQAGAAEPRPASWLPEAQWLICPARSSGSLGFAAKGGGNDEPHNHNDIGSFQLALGKTQLIAELGAGEYTRDYFAEARYSILCNSSLGHSVPIIDGRGQEAGAERRARSVECRMDGGRTFLSMDISRAYDNPWLRRLTRTFEFEGFSALSLRDDFELAAAPPAAIVERFVTGLPAALIAIGKGGAMLEAQGLRLFLSCSIPDLAPRLVLLEHRAHDGSRVEAACLDFELPRGVDSVSFELALRGEAGA